MSHLENIETVTVKITKDNLPKGPRWDEDHACFEAETCDPALFGCDWRWVPKNWKAFEKGKPDKELFDFAPPQGHLTQSGE